MTGLQNRRVSSTLTAASPPAVAPDVFTTGRAAEAWPLAPLERWFLRLVVLAFPLAFSWSTYDGYVLPKLLVARALIAGLAVLWLARVALAGSVRLRRTPLDLPLLAFVASAALSTAFAYNQNVAIFGTYSRYDGLLTTLAYAAAFWLTVQCLRSGGDARGLLRTLIASGYAVAVVAIVKCATDSLHAGQLVPAYGTLGQKNTLGAFLVVLLPLAYWEAASAKAWAARLLAANAVGLIAIALGLTFSRSAWAAGALGLAIAVFGVHRQLRARIALAAAGAVVVVAAVGFYATSAVAFQRTDLSQLGDRPSVYADTLRLIASRPLLGYGPDNFGLVFPAFESIDLHQPWDKAHAETLQIAATQGLAGLAAYAWLLFAFARAFRRGRRDPAAFAVLGAWAAYQAMLQINFTALSAAFPYWIFLAAALELTGSTRESVLPITRYRRAAVAAAALGVPLVAGFAMYAMVPAYLADQDLLRAVIYDYSGRSDLAAAPAAEAFMLAPNDSVYATEVGNIAFEKGDWAAARIAYGRAWRLGTYNDAVPRNLALADQHLGLIAEARAAARNAVALNRFDPANVALLAQMTS